MGVRWLLWWGQGGVAGGGLCLIPSVQLPGLVCRALGIVSLLLLLLLLRPPPLPPGPQPPAGSSVFQVSPCLFSLPDFPSPQSFRRTLKAVFSPPLRAILGFSSLIHLFSACSSSTRTSLPGLPQPGRSVRSSDGTSSLLKPSRALQVPTLPPGAPSTLD